MVRDLGSGQTDHHTIQLSGDVVVASVYQAAAASMRTTYPNAGHAADGNQQASAVGPPAIAGVIGMALHAIAITGARLHGVFRIE